MSGGGAGGSRTTIAPTGTIEAMAMTTGDIVAIERPTATMADVMRAVTAGGDAVGIATTIDPEAPKATTTVERKSPPFRRAFCWRVQRAAAMGAASAWWIADIPAPGSLLAAYAAIQTAATTSIGRGGAITKLPKFGL